MEGQNKGKKASHHPGFGSDEEWVHFFTHLLGVIFILWFGRFLWFADHLPGNLQWGLFIYLITFLFVFAASSLYHLRYLEKHRSKLRKLDHVAIYFFIAGSNTPYLLGYASGNSGIYFLIIMWLMVLAGILIKYGFFKMSEWMSLIYYLLMGWLGIITMFFIYPEIKFYTIGLIIFGGILYSAGAYFYRHDYRKWYHSIWHVLVLSAAVAHFAAIFQQVW